MNNKNSYSAEKITVLKGLEAVRKRPAMYIGDVGKRGFHHLVNEVIDNSIDEALAGFCTKIIVTIEKDGSISIEDNGRGIPVEIHKEEGIPALEVVMTILHAGGKFDKNTYKVSGGLHGVGVSVVNALSENLRAEVHRDGEAYEQEYQIGKAVSPVKKIGKSDKTGTIINFIPDSTIFKNQSFEEEIIKIRLKELAYLNKNLVIILKNNITEEEETKFHFSGGLSDFVKYLDGDEDLIHNEIITVSREEGEVPVDLALRYSTSYNNNIFSFVNNINTIEGGTHLSGFRSALTRALNSYANKNDLIKAKKNEKFSLSGDDFREGLTAVLSIKVQEPQFEGQTKTKLGNGEIKGIVDRIIYDGIQAFLEENPKVGKRIIEKAAEAARARIAAKKARELVRKKSGLGATLPGKLADCSNKDPLQCEIFLVEGDSAGGTAKQGRDRRTQAILPLRGKVINSEKAREDKLLSNNEIQSIITALGAGFGEDETDPNSFNLEKLRYHKVVIMTDADVDGSHIRTLLLTFFWRKMKRLVQNGHVYMARPPFYKLKQGKKERYAYTDEERDLIIQRLETENSTTKIDVQRYKGLGEMNADQLWNTTMNAETRTLIQVTVDHIMEEETNVRFRELMGSEVEHRRKFITERAKFATNIDV
jgi:DNA gyrase subunit B|tara:strand:+ start:932 stop:2878 length:1947 start_codon:yes stop_codon:yes gene_type:complete